MLYSFPSLPSHSPLVDDNGMTAKKGGIAWGRLCIFSLVLVLFFIAQCLPSFLQQQIGNRIVLVRQSNNLIYIYICKYPICNIIVLVNLLIFGYSCIHICCSLARRKRKMFWLFLDLGSIIDCIKYAQISLYSWHLDYCDLQSLN